jgi:phenylpropionate dioxygenase-like ring-hydroxylating dioxygenase large terminal subunit
MHGTVPPERRGNEPDLRRIGLNPDFWYPVARSKDLKRGSVIAASFAGEPIALVRTDSGKVFALEDRCAHRQMPLSCGVVAGEHIKCCYHAWTYNAAGRCTVPYLPKGTPLPSGVRSYPCREASGLIFVFPGDAARADTVSFPDLPALESPTYRSMLFARQTKCHYSFMHENLMDMNHQFLHRRVTGKLKATHLDTRHGDGFVEVDYSFDQYEGKTPIASRFMQGHAVDNSDAGSDLVTIRTQYPYQSLTLRYGSNTDPLIKLWAAYVPLDREQRVNYTVGLLAIRKPRFAWLLHPAWPVIRHFTEKVFAEDRFAVEAEQRAYDAQGGDWNQEVLPYILDLRRLLIAGGIPIEAAGSAATAREQDVPA